MVKPGIALLIRVCFSARIADRFALSCAGKLLSENCRTPWASKSSEIGAFLEMPAIFPEHLHLGKYGLTERLKSGSLAASSYVFW